MKKKSLTNYIISKYGDGIQEIIINYLLAHNSLSFELKKRLINWVRSEVLYGDPIMGWGMMYSNLKILNFIVKKQKHFKYELNFNIELAIDLNEEDDDYPENYYKFNVPLQIKIYDISKQFIKQCQK